ncbi:unnamed protein product [Euphydryas editha]|uniref:Uncharacterized protein n=1 Tax=Euphydryas editha TaxID=104508 RepID=A0AAU9TPI7_EUPED|nr:unnamed protein product [Euphydryas editha]
MKSLMSIIDVFKKSILDEFTSRNKEASINFLEVRYESIKNDLLSKTDMIKSLQSNHKTLQTTVSDLQSRLSRIMKFNKDSPRPHSVLIKFSTTRFRDTFLAATIAFNEQAKCNEDKLNTNHIGIGVKKYPIYITEYLPPATKALHIEAGIKAK